MTATRTVFYGFGCYVGQFITVTQCGWWPQDPTTLVPAYDPAKLVTTDIGKNPQAVRTGAITAANIQADDAPAHGGLTKVGPTFPAGSTVNGLWLESNFYNALSAATKPARVPPGMQCRDYELATVLYWSGPLANRRYWGAYAEIVAQTGTTAQCKLWAPGTSLVPGQAAQTTAWLDLAQPSVAHPIEPGFTAVGTGVGAPKQGALFVDSAVMSSLRLAQPKLPPSLGGALYPPMRPR